MRKKQVIVEQQVNLQDIRQALADYMKSEGYDCCRDIESHERHAKRIAKLLKVPKRKDSSGYNFAKFRSAKT